MVFFLDIDISRVVVVFLVRERRLGKTHKNFNISSKINYLTAVSVVSLKKIHLLPEATTTA